MLTESQRSTWITSATTLLILCLVLSSCSPGTESSPKVDPNLEKQVLEIIRKNPEVILESVQAYQERKQGELEAARTSVLEQLKTNPKAVIGDSPIQGAGDAKIVLVEFSDFQCPFCARAHTTVTQFMAKHKGRVTLTYKHLPLVSIHSEAMPAAQASWAAQQQGKFWEYHDALFKAQDQLGEDLYVKIAQDLQLNLEKFNQDRQSEAAKTAINKDLELANSLGISGTPFFILNGETFSGAVELAEMEEVLARVGQ